MIMKVKVFCNSGANIHSTRTDIVETTDYGYSDEEWEAASDDDKYKLAEEWAWECLEIGWEEV
jgi:hypothetical protein